MVLLVLAPGALALLPLLAILVLAAAFLVPAGAAWSLSALAAPHPALAAALAALVLAGAAFATEQAARKRGARRKPGWTMDLHALSRCERPDVEAVGGKALLLSALCRLGAPVPEALVLTTRFVDALLAAAKEDKSPDGIWARLPGAGRRELDAFLQGSKGKLVVRASFLDASPAHSFAGVFPAERDVEARRERVVEAVLALVESMQDPVAREYRRRCKAGACAARAIVVQRQIEVDTAGAIASRGPASQADSITVDFARRRSPTRSHRYDLLDGKAAPLLPDAAFVTPAWMHRLAVLAVVVEDALGGPVEMEFGLEGPQAFVLGVRRTAAPERKTWVHAPPLDASGERLSTFAQELRGGLGLVRKVLSGTLERAGARADVREEEVRYVEGLVFVDVEVLRRALARLGGDVLLRGGLLSTVRAVAAVRRFPLPSLPATTEITADAWDRLRRWHARHLLRAAEVRLELVAREWLIQVLLRLLDGGPSAADRRGHPALRWLLLRRARECADEAARQLTLLVQAETELGGAVARLLARGAAVWNAMFKGDRHLHATLDEIDRWHTDTAAREALEGQWGGRRKLAERRRDQAVVPRLHRPPLPEDAPQPSARFRGIGVVAGTGTGPAVLVGGRDATIGAGSVLLLADSRADLCPLLYEASGVVLLSGGLASPVAALASELGVPVVLCPEARGLPASRAVTIDGASGAITV